MPELATRHARGALDVAEALLQLAVGGLQPEPLGVLDLQVFIDHLAQDLGGHALAQLRTVLQARRPNGEQHSLGQVEIGDGVVVHPRDHAQALGRCESRRQCDDDDEKSAEEERGHCTGRVMRDRHYIPRQFCCNGVRGFRVGLWQDTGVLDAKQPVV